MKFKPIFFTAILFAFLSTEAFAINLPSSGRNRLKNTVRTKNIYGVSGGHTLSNSRLYGDYEGLSNNYFGSPSSNTRSSRSQYDYDRELLKNCNSQQLSGYEYRPHRSVGYEKGLTACEAVEYKEFLKRQR